MNIGVGAMHAPYLNSLNLVPLYRLLATSTSVLPEFIFLFYDAAQTFSTRVTKFIHLPESQVTPGPLVKPPTAVNLGWAGARCIPPSPAMTITSEPPNEMAAAQHPEPNHHLPAYKLKIKLSELIECIAAEQ